MGTGKLSGQSLTKCWEVTYDGLASHPGGVAVLLVASTETGISSGSCRPLDS